MHTGRLLGSQFRPHWHCAEPIRPGFNSINYVCGTKPGTRCFVEFKFGIKKWATERTNWGGNGSERARNKLQFHGHDNGNTELKRSLRWLASISNWQQDWAGNAQFCFGEGELSYTTRKYTFHWLISGGVQFSKNNRAASSLFQILKVPGLIKCLGG